MRKSNLYMFLILQVLLIITNVFNLNNDVLILDLSDVLKLCIITFSLINILFISEYNLLKKISYLLILGATGAALIFEEAFASHAINIYYYISTYTYLFSSYKMGEFKRYKVINIFTLLLFGVIIYTLIFSKNSINYELLICLLLPVSLSYYHTNKKLLVPLMALTILTGYLNNMNFVLLNVVIVSVILLIKTKSISEVINSALIFITSLILLIVNMKDVSYLDLFYKLYVDPQYSSLVIMLPLLFLACKVLSNYIESKNKPLDLTLNVYTILIYHALAVLALQNIPEISLLVFTYIFIISIDRIEYLNKNIKDEVTIMSLHLGYGGIEQYISSLTKMIDKKITIFSTYKLYEKDPFEYNAKKKYLLKCGPNTKEIKDALKNKRIFESIKEGFKSVCILYKKKYENIETIENINTKYIITTRDFHNEYTGFYARKDIIKIATEHNTSDDDCYARKVINSVKNVDYLVLVSKSQENYYKDKVKCMTLFIPNVLDKLPNKSSKAKDHSLVTVGRLAKVKAQDDLIKVVELLKKDYDDVSLTIIGDGEEKDNLIKLIKDKKLDKNVRITGFLDKNDIELELVNKNVFVMTSLSESFGLAAIEAASYKLPVVAFDSAEGLKDILENGNGILIKNRDLKKMKEEISKLFEDKKYRDKIAKNGYENSKKYLIENVKETWQKIIH